MSTPEPSIESAPEASIVAVSTRTDGRGRDARLDFFRGLALLTIFINHIPGTPYENWTSRNFGFSDAAEAFFVMSGVAAALAYSRRFQPEALGTTGLWPAVSPIWSRAWKLYLVHLALTIWAIAIVFTAAGLSIAPDMLTYMNLPPIFADPLGALSGIPMLTHQLGYVNILPVYAVLLLISPLLILLATRAPKSLAIGSALLWFFNPFAWQAVFVTGLLIGAALARGERLLPVKHNWVVLCAIFLLVSLLWRQIPSVGHWFDNLMWRLGQFGLPFHIVGHDKTFLALPRLLHVLALTYLLSCLPVVRRLAETRACGWLRLLGRQGLLVFSLGTLLAILSQTFLHGFPDEHWLVFAIVPIGLAIQLLAAWIAQRAALAKRGKPDVQSAGAGPEVAVSMIETDSKLTA